MLTTPTMPAGVEWRSRKWQDDPAGPRPTAAIHDAWIRFVLTETLGLDEKVLVEGQAVAQSLQVSVPEHNEVLRPDRVVKDPKGDPNEGKPRLLIQTYPSGQDLRKPVRGRQWKAWPESRMADLLHGTGVRLGLVTNGEQWMLVDAPKGETTAFISWYATLWLEEPVTLARFEVCWVCGGSSAWPRRTLLRRCWPRVPPTSRMSPTSLAIRSARRSRCSSGRSTGPTRTMGGLCFPRSRRSDCTRRLSR